MRPLVFIHTGKYRYLLEYVLRQAKKHNAKREIILLGGDGSRKYRSLVKIHPIDASDADFIAFGNAYRHMSPNPYAFELFCFQRWLCLKRFLQDTGIPSCYAVDSDVMIYDDFTRLDSVVDGGEGDGKGYDYAAFILGDPYVMPCVTFMTLPYVSEFSEFLLSSYSGETCAAYNKIYNDMLEKKVRSGISDMAALNLFYKKVASKFKVLDLCNREDGGLFDINIPSPSQGGRKFAMRDGIKDIEFIGGIPHCFDEIGGKSLPFSTLHFQGNAKRCIPFYYTGKRFPRQFLHMFQRMLARHLREKKTTRPR